MSFFKKSLEELDHVVWPTNVESKKYMMYTVGTIIVMSALLTIIGQAIQFSLKEVRNAFPHEQIITPTVSGEEVVTEADIEKLRTEAEKRRNALSGAKIDLETTPNSPVTEELNLSGSGN